MSTKSIPLWVDVNRALRSRGRWDAPLNVKVGVPIRRRVCEFVERCLSSEPVNKLYNTYTHYRRALLVRPLRRCTSYRRRRRDVLLLNVVHTSWHIISTDFVCLKMNGFVIVVMNDSRFWIRFLKCSVFELEDYCLAILRHFHMWRRGAQVTLATCNFVIFKKLYSVM